MHAGRRADAPRAGSVDQARHFAALVICCGLGVAGVWQIRGDGGVIGWLLACFLALAARFYLWPRSGELKLVGTCLLALLGLVAALVACLFLAWESGEVVVLRSTSDQGKRIEDRLWVIDLEGRPSIATGSEKSRVERLRAHPHVELVRGDRVECRRAIVIPESEATRESKRAAERLFEEKYGLRLHATRLLALFFGVPSGEETVLIRLEPCS